jgi:hypothetical protein
MKTLIIYDNNGRIFSQISGSYSIPQGDIQHLEIEIPEGKQLKIDKNGIGVDVSITPHQPILEDIPPTEVNVLLKQVADLQYQLMINGVL